jgi:lysozyme family protein
MPLACSTSPKGSGPPTQNISENNKLEAYKNATLFVYFLMTNRFLDIYRIVMEYEGGYVNHPNDPGGETYKGISRRAHSNWEGWKFIDQRKPVPENLVQKFYYDNYWTRLRCEEIPYPVGEYLFDFGVNAGITRAVITVQRALNNVKVDGVLGPVTMGAIQKQKPQELMYELLRHRIRYYTTITLQNSRFQVFFLGWIRRTIEVFERLMDKLRK